MGWFKRLCLFVYGLAGLLALAALMLPWVGPYTSQATTLLTGNLNYWYAVLAVVAITGLGALICLLRSLFTPRNRKMVTVSRVDGGQITVTRTAIASQSKHIVEKDGTCVAANTRVRVRKHSVRVRMKVTPKHALNVVEKGAQLHDELVQGLQGVCGNTLKDVSLVFTDPQSFEEPKPDYLSTTYAGYDASEPAVSAASSVASDATSYLPSEAPQESADVTDAGDTGSLDGITVPLRPARRDEVEDGSPAPTGVGEAATQDAAASDAGEPAGDGVALPGETTSLEDAANVDVVEEDATATTSGATEGEPSAALAAAAGSSEVAPTASASDSQGQTAGDAEEPRDDSQASSEASGVSDTISTGEDA